MIPKNVFSYFLLQDNFQFTGRYLNPAFWVSAERADMYGKTILFSISPIS